MKAKVQLAQLQYDMDTVYDPTKTYLAGDVFQKMLGVDRDGNEEVPVIGASLNKYADVFADSGEVPLYIWITPNNRLFAVTAAATGRFRLMYATWNPATGVYSYVGKVILPVPYGGTAIPTQTIRSAKADDSVTSNIQVFIYTVASGTNATQYSGVLRTNKLDITDFVTNPSNPTLNFATEDDQKAVYWELKPDEMGVLNIEITGTGLAYKPDTKTGYVLFGTGVSHRIRWRDFSITPTYTKTTVSISVASPGKVTYASHPFQNNDTVIFPSGYGGTLPTGLAFDTVYFVRNSSAGDFELSATFGGTSINTTGSPGSADIGRAFGATSSAWVNTTGICTTSLGATLLFSNALYFVTPGSGHASLNGVPCLFGGSTTNLFLIPISDISPGVISFPNLLVVNLLGSTNQVIAPVAANVTWSSTFDRAVFTTSTTKIIAKKVINNAIENIFGVLNNDYLEGSVGTEILKRNLITQFGAITISDLYSSPGWIHIVGGTTGQRGILSMKTGCDWSIGNDYIITKVMDIGHCLSFIGVASAQQRGQECTTTKVYYRTSGFGSASGGWIAIPDSNLLNSISPIGITQIQFKIMFRGIDQLISNPAQLIEFYFAYLPLKMFSDNWVGSGKLTTQDISPAKTAFRLVTPYSTVKTMRMIAFEDDGTIYADKNTTTNYTEFSKTNNNGLTVAPMSSANDYYNTGSGEELVIYNWTTPPDRVLNITWIEAD